MDEDRLANLARKLHRWGVSDLAASLLETARPLVFLGAQALYFVGPLLSAFTPEEEVVALARLLEDPAAAHALAVRLTEES